MYQIHGICFIEWPGTQVCLEKYFELPFVPIEGLNFRFGCSDMDEFVIPIDSFEWVVDDNRFEVIFKESEKEPDGVEWLIGGLEFHGWNQTEKYG